LHFKALQAFYNYLNIRHKDAQCSAFLPNTRWRLKASLYAPGGVLI
jgi:hypothetical protein